mmetsp:Transcript_14863/g.30790  ORF Transcript_14863/g.30790 Transcript_14863/m.30790 type:complete len:223 (-) Transcript_14863:96-764(-)
MRDGCSSRAGCATPRPARSKGTAGFLPPPPGTDGASNATARAAANEEIAFSLSLSAESKLAPRTASLRSTPIARHGSARARTDQATGPGRRSRFPVPAGRRRRETRGTQPTEDGTRQPKNFRGPRCYICAALAPNRTERGQKRSRRGWWWCRWQHSPKPTAPPPPSHRREAAQLPALGFAPIPALLGWNTATEAHDSKIARKKTRIVVYASTESWYFMESGS